MPDQLWYFLTGPGLVLRHKRSTQGDTRVCDKWQSDISVHVRSRQQQWHISWRWSDSWNNFLYL